MSHTHEALAWSTEASIVHFDWQWLSRVSDANLLISPTTRSLDQGMSGIAPGPSTCKQMLYQMLYHVPYSQLMGVSGSGSRIFLVSCRL